MDTIDDGNKSAKTSSIGEVLLRAIENSAKYRPLGAELTRRIWLYVVKDYLENKIDERCLFNISSYLFYSVNNPNNLKIDDKNLAQSLCFSGEWLFWYKHKNQPESFNKELEKLKLFFEQNKHLIGET